MSCVTKENMGVDQTIALMNVYLTEWCHRNEMLWRLVYRCFYATLVVILLPNIAPALSITIPPLPVFVFRIVGLSMAPMFLFISIGYAKRAEASDRTYQMMIDMFPPEYQRKCVSNEQIRAGRFFSARMSVIICPCMFIALVALAIALLVVG